MKKIRLAVTSLACFVILLPTFRSVNQLKTTPNRPLLERADGNPPPIPLPPWASQHSAAV
jgi:hypothetical protein